MSSTAQKNISIVSYIGFGIVFILWITGLTYFTATAKNLQIPNNVASKERMTTISQTFAGIFGPNWPALFMLFAVIFLIFAVLLYIIARKGIDLTMSNVHYNAYKWIGITLAALLSILVIAAVVQIILSQVNSPEGDPDYNPNTAKIKQNRLIIEIIVVVAGGLALFGLLMWYIKSHKKRRKILSKLRSSKKSTRVRG